MKLEMKWIPVLMLASAIPILAGCSSQNQTPPPDSTTAQSQPQAAPTPAPAESSEPDSVLGATAHAVATIVLLPFRIVADVVGLIL
ncbi:MAG TPA: hypothetical protein VEC38_14685 [Candidatus Binataceae bacterium]|nr:hypothetical protein [Candidatus Binataceae bacterium]